MAWFKFRCIRWLEAYGTLLDFFYTIYPICLSMISAERFVTRLLCTGGIASLAAPIASTVALRNVRNRVLFSVQGFLIQHTVWVLQCNNFPATSYYPPPEVLPRSAYQYHVSFCLMKKARRWDSCQAQVTPNTMSCSRVHLTTLAFVDSD